MSDRYAAHNAKKKKCKENKIGLTYLLWIDLFVIFNMHKKKFRLISMVKHNDVLDKPKIEAKIRVLANTICNGREKWKFIFHILIYNWHSIINEIAFRNVLLAMFMRKCTTFFFLEQYELLAVKRAAIVSLFFLSLSMKYKMPNDLRENFIIYDNARTVIIAVRLDKHNSTNFNSVRWQ